MGRYSGLFNQPSEAGVAYSLGLFLAIYVFARKPKLLYSAIAAIMIGGALTVSKIFIFIGIPIGIVQFMLTPRKNSFRWAVFWVIALVAAITGSGFLAHWDGLSYFQRLFVTPSASDAVSLYTAGRWTEGSSMLAIITATLATSPLAGFGFAGLNTAYDSAWTQIIVTSGLIGAVCLVIIMVKALLVPFHAKDAGVRFLGWAVAALLIGGNFGIPVLTSNRVGSLMWIVLVLVATQVSRGTRASVTEVATQLSQR